MQVCWLKKASAKTKRLVNNTTANPNKACACNWWITQSSLDAWVSWWWSCSCRNSPPRENPKKRIAAKNTADKLHVLRQWFITVGLYQKNYSCQESQRAYHAYQHMCPNFYQIKNRRAYFTIFCLLICLTKMVQVTIPIIIITPKNKP